MALRTHVVIDICSDLTKQICQEYFITSTACADTVSHVNELEEMEETSE